MNDKLRKGLLWGYAERGLVQQCIFKIGARLWNNEHQIAHNHLFQQTHFNWTFAVTWTSASQFSFGLGQVQQQISQLPAMQNVVRHVIEHSNKLTNQN